MTIWTKQNNEWKIVKTPWAKELGTWIDPKFLDVRVGSEWRRVYPGEYVYILAKSSVSKIDNVGNILWKKVLPTSNQYRFGYKILTTKNSVYVMQTRIHYVNRTSEYDIQWYDVWFYKLDPWDGEILSQYNAGNQHHGGKLNFFVDKDEYVYISTNRYWLKMDSNLNTVYDGPEAVGWTPLYTAYESGQTYENEPVEIPISGGGGTTPTEIGSQEYHAPYFSTYNTISQLDYANSYLYTYSKARIYGVNTINTDLYYKRDLNFSYIEQAPAYIENDGNIASRTNIRCDNCTDDNDEKDIMEMPSSTMWEDDVNPENICAIDKNGNIYWLQNNKALSKTSPTDYVPYSWIWLNYLYVGPGNGDYTLRLPLNQYYKDLCFEYAPFGRGSYDKDSSGNYIVNYFYGDYRLVESKEGNDTYTNWKFVQNTNGSYIFYWGIFRNNSWYRTTWPTPNNVQELGTNNYQIICGNQNLYLYNYEYVPWSGSQWDNLGNTIYIFNLDTGIPASPKGYINLTNILGGQFRLKDMWVDLEENLYTLTYPDDNLNDGVLSKFSYDSGNYNLEYNLTNLYNILSLGDYEATVNVSPEDSRTVGDGIVGMAIHPGRSNNGEWL